jgi:folate-binding protein YgfZ
MSRPFLDSMAWVDRSDRLRVRVSGPDRAKCLHNLTTNEVKRLAMGAGCEAFVTSPQGKILAMVTLLSRPDDLLVGADAAAREGLLAHLAKYAIFDDVQIDDLSAETFEWHIVGPQLEDLVARLGIAWPGPALLASGEGRIADVGMTLYRDDPLGPPGLTLIGPVEASPRVDQALRAASDGLGLVSLQKPHAELLRIAAGTPVFGQDISTDNLPQEVGRDGRAISFVKGCYLGQETVARIDALGHVNRHLRRLHLEGPMPPSGTPLIVEGKPVGKVTSAAPLPGQPYGIGLGYVRTAHADPRAVLSYEVAGTPGTATVLAPEAEPT